MRSVRHFKKPLLPTRFLVCTFITLFTFSTKHQHQYTASAQSSFTPIISSAPAFARTQTKLYILGGDGSSTIGTIGQFMSLDLGVSWNVTTPAWTQLPDGPKQSLFPAAFSSDDQTMFVFHLANTNSPWQYNVKSNTWEVSKIAFENMAWQGLNVVTDPRTGLMYIPGGYNNAGTVVNSPAFSLMETFDPITLSINHSPLPVPDQVFPVRWYYQNVWSSKKNLILYFGGNYRQGEKPFSPGLENIVTAFEPSSLSWFTFVTPGLTPEMRADHCMAANEDGTKVLLYGGRLRNQTVSGQVFVLDVVTQQWSERVPGPPRMYAACAVAGDQLIIWGGRSSETLVASTGLMVYNFNTNTWVNQYVPPASYGTLKPPPVITRTAPPWGTATTSTSKSTSTRTGIPTSSSGPNPVSPSPTSAPVPVGIIAGGVVGGLALAAAVVGIFFMRYRRNQRNGRGFFVKPTRDGSDESQSLAIGAASLSAGGGSGRRRRESLGKDPMESNEEYELERTLMEIEEQKRELEMRQQQLVLQHRAENPESVSPSSPTSAGGSANIHKRGPSAYVEPEAEYIPITSGPYLDPKVSLSPRSPSTSGTLFSEKSSLSPSSTPIGAATMSGSVRTASPTYAIPSAHSQSYISPSSIVRTSSTAGIQGGLVQITPEPVYEPTGGVDATYPDLVYGSAQMGGGKDWVRSAQGPQVVVVPEEGSSAPRGPEALLPSPFSPL